MNLDDAIYNWLSIKLVAEAREDDLAAKDTYEFFSDILSEDHRIEQIEANKEDDWYIVTFVSEGEQQKKQYPSELIEALLLQIESEPKYN